MPRIYRGYAVYSEMPGILAEFAISLTVDMARFPKNPLRPYPSPFVELSILFAIVYPNSTVYSGYMLQCLDAPIPVVEPTQWFFR